MASSYKTVEDFIADGLSYHDAVSAYYAQTSQQQPQASSSGFGWFWEAVHDPNLERVYRAQQEWMSSQQSLLGRYTPAQLAAYGLSPPMGSPYVQSVPPTAPPSTLPSMRPTPM